jgi:cytochrome c1
VTFLAYSANPVKLESQRIGTYVAVPGFLLRVRLLAQA